MKALSVRQTIGPLIFIGLASIFISLFNGYPLVTSDTGAYINNGFLLQVAKDRPIVYSIFLRFFSLQFSTWLVVFIQGCLIAFLLKQSVNLLNPSHGEAKNRTFYIISLLTVAFTTLPWYASQLMPDIFTSIMVLGIIIYFFRQSGKGTYWYLLIILSGCLMHTSHILILLMAGFTLLIYFFINRRSEHLRGYMRKTLILLAISLTSILLTSTANSIAGHGFTLSPASHVFLMGKLCENGVLQSYLDDVCAEKNYGLCEYKNNLPEVAWAFVWDDNSPLNQMGGWEATKGEYKSIIKDIALSPKYYPSLIFKSIEHTLRQLTQIYIGDGLQSFRENTNPYWKIEQYYSHELPEYMNSKQNTNSLDVKAFNIVYAIFLALTCIWILFLWGKFPQNSIIKLVYLILIIFLLSNAFVTANFANVLARLNSRVIWLLPFLNVIFIYSYYLKKSENNIKAQNS